MAKDDDDSKSSWDRLRDMFSRLPTAIAAAIVNAQAKPVGLTTDAEQQTNATNAPQQPQANPAAGFATAVRAMLPSMARYFDRADHATAGGVSAQQPFVPTVFKPQHADFGKVDWSDVIGRAVARVVQISPRGPGTATFRPQSHGDVNVDMADAKAQRAANAATWGDPFGTHARRKAKDDATTAWITGATNVGAFTPKPPNFSQMPNAPISSWTRISANFKAWARSAGANARYAAKRAWSHAKGNRYGTGQRVPGSMASSFRGFGSRIGRGVIQGFGPGSRVYKAVNHARKTGWAALNAPNAAAASAILPHASEAFTRFMSSLSIGARVLQGMTDFAEQRTASNRRLGMFNPAISHAYAQLDLGDVRRNMWLSRQTQESTISVVHATNRMRDSFRDWDKMTTELGNRLAGFSSGFMGTIGTAVSAPANWIERRLPTQKQAEAAGSFFAIDAALKAAAPALGPIWGPLLTEFIRRRMKAAAPAPAVDQWAASLQAIAKKGPFLPQRPIGPVRP